MGAKGQREKDELEREREHEWMNLRNEDGGSSNRVGCLKKKKKQNGAFPFLAQNDLIFFIFYFLAVANGNTLLLSSCKILFSLYANTATLQLLYFFLKI